MNLDLKGKSVLVTGGNRGVGLGISQPKTRTCAAHEQGRVCPGEHGAKLAPASGAVRPVLAMDAKSPSFDKHRMRISTESPFHSPSS